MTIIITLSFAGNETGPFDLYSDATNFATPFAQGITKAALLAGFQVDAPAGTTVVRLDDLSGLCLNTKTDIYTCATPNCDFAGEILCNITTTTTTSTPPTTTTTSTPPPAGLCLWSTNGGNPGSVAVYSFDTNTSTEVLVPNDFESTIGINRPICSTSNKLYLLSVKVSTDSYQYLREWDITVSSPGAVPTLTYVREFRIQPGSIPYAETTGRVISAIAVTNNIFMAALGTPSEETYRMSVVTWGLPAVGEPILTLRYATQSPSTTQAARSFSSISLTYGNQSAPGTSRYLAEITSMWMANSGDVMLNLRLDIKPEFNETENVGNWLKQMKGIPPANSSLDDQYEWSLNSNLSTLIRLQDSGVPEFTTSYIGNLAMPTWGRDGILQVLQPETLVVYNIDQSLPHAATIETSVNDYNVWLSSANGCANVILPEGFGSCTPTNLPQLTIDGLGAPGQAPLSYLGPQTFQFEGQTVTASSQTWQGIAGYNDAGYNQQAIDYINSCGITFTGETIPGDLLTRTVTFGRSGSGSDLDNPAFDYNLSFENPITNLTFKFDNLDSWSNSSADYFRFEVNNGTPTIAIIEGCNVEINAPNEFRPVAGTLQGEASAVISMQSTQPFTTFTLSGTNGGAGGPVWLGCSTAPLDCNLIYPNSSTLEACSSNPGVCYPGMGGFVRIYAWNPISFVREEIVLPAGSYMSYPNFAVSENYLIADLEDFSFLPGNITRYGYTLGTNGVPENVTWDEVFYTYPAEWNSVRASTVETISDTKFVGLWSSSSESKVLEIEIIEGTTELQVTEKWENTDFRLTGDALLTLKEDGTPNKLIAPSIPFGSSSPETGNLKQFDYLTGALEGTLDLPTGIRSTASIGMIGQYIYISVREDQIIDPSLHNLWRVDISTSIWSIVPQGQAPVEFTNGGAADFGSRLECRISDGLTKFTPDTTTTTTTPDSSGTKTIWTWFESELNS